MHRNFLFLQMRFLYYYIFAPNTVWTAEIPVPKGVKNVEIWSKAVDSNYNVQPETFENTWNLRGVLSNAYSRVKVNIK